MNSKQHAQKREEERVKAKEQREQHDGESHRLFPCGRCNRLLREHLLIRVYEVNTWYCPRCWGQVRRYVLAERAKLRQWAAKRSA